MTHPALQFSRRIQRGMFVGSVGFEEEEGELVLIIAHDTGHRNRDGDEIVLTVERSFPPDKVTLEFIASLADDNHALFQLWERLVTKAYFKRGWGFCA